MRLSDRIKPQLGVSPRPGRRPASVAVIGGGLGGLSAAIHLSLTGHKVTIFEANERVGGRANLIEQAGFRFDTGPSLLNYPWVFADLFAAAGRQLSDYVTLLPVEPAVSFQWPNGTRLTLSSYLPSLLAEFERLEPGVRPRALAFLRDAARKYQLSFERLVTRNEDNYLKWLGALSLGELARTGVWRSLERELRRFFRSQYIREALGAYGMYLGGSPYHLPGLFSILAYGELAYGLWLPKGGIYGLVSGIERLARELGVHILTEQRVRRIITKDRRVVGLELPDGKLYPTELVVSNVDVPTTDTELLEPEAAGRRVMQAERTKMTPGVITFYWGVRDSVAKLGHHTIFLPADYRGAFADLFERQRIPADLPFYVSVPSATDPDLAPAGSSAIFVLVPTPLLSELPNLDWPATVAQVKGRVLARLQQQGIPLTAEAIAVETVYTPVDWRERFGLYDGSAFGAAHTLGQMGPRRARNYSSEVAGLYYVGAGTTPGTGLPMVVLSGQMVAERIQQLSGQPVLKRPALESEADRLPVPVASPLRAGTLRQTD